MENYDQKEWTPEEEARLFQARSNFVPYKVIAAQLNRSLKSCECKYRETDWTTRGFLTNNKPRRAAEKQTAVQKLSNTYDNKLEIMRLRADVLADRIVENIPRFPEAPTIYIPKASKAKMKHSPEDVGLLLSDLHIGHKHSLEETGGLSEYSVETFLERVENLKKAVVEIVELHSHLYSIPKLHIFALGDIVDGMNAAGKWSAAYIDIPVIDQVMIGVRAMADMIYHWLGLFEEIEIYAIGGNHGRSAEKGIEKEYVNWDYMAYKMLETMFLNNPRVRIKAPKTWWMCEEIRNHKFLMMHGEDVKGGNFPIQSLAKIEQKLIGLIKEIPDYTLAGHFHSAAELTTNHGRVILNGSFIGSDVHSLKSIQSGSKPEQKFFGIHDDRGITWTYNIDLACKRD